MRTNELFRFVTCLSLCGLAFAAVGCEDECQLHDDGEIASSELGLVRGRVRAADGSELERVTVRVDGQSARTDGDGLFELEVPAGEQRRIRVDSEQFAGGEAVVRVERGDVTSLDLSVMQLRTLRIPDAERGGRFEGDDGFALELPERALRTQAGEVARGEAELRYAVVLSPQTMRVPPDLRARNEDGDDVRLRSHGMVEVRFYQRDERLEFEGEARTELPLPDGSRLRDGDRPGMYHYDTDSVRWVEETEATVEDGKWVATLDRFSWWTAAEPIDALACISATLLAPSGEPAEGTVVTAVGLSDLWLSTALSDEDGEVCVEAPLETELVLSAFFESDGERGEWSVEESTPDEPGMCGGNTCSELGEQAFEGGPIAPPAGGTAGTGGEADGGTTGQEGGADTGGDAGDGTTGSASTGGSGNVGNTTGDGGTGAAFGGLMETGQTSSPGETVSFTFDAVGRELLAYRVTSTADTLASVRVYDPTGNSVSGSTTSVAAGSTAFADQFRLPEMAGEYRVEIRPNSEGEGSFMLDLFGVPEDASDAVEVDGSSVSLSIGNVAQNGRLTFEAEGGERLAFTVDSTVSTYSTLRVLDPMGDRVPNVAVTVPTNNGRFSDQFTLPSMSGTYTLSLDPNAQGTGTLTVSLFSVSLDDAQSITVGGSASLSIDGAGQNGRITFEAAGDERLAYTVDSSVSTYTTVRLRGPTGAIVSSASRTVSANASVFGDSFRLEGGEGTYTFELDPNQQGTGGLTLNLFAVPEDDVVPITLATGPTAPTDVTITTAGQNGLLTFTVTPQMIGGGEEDPAVLAYFVDSTLDTYATLRVRDSNGVVVSSAGRTVSAGGSEFQDFPLPVVAGDYTLEIDPNGQGTGTVSVDLYQVPAPAGETEGPFALTGYALATERSVITTSPGQKAVVRYTASAGSRVAYLVDNNGDTYVATRLIFPPDETVEGSTGGVVGAGSEAFRGPFDLPDTSGEYVLEVDPNGPGTGEYRVRMFEVTPATRTDITSVGGADVVLDLDIPGQTGEVSFTPGEGTVFTFTVESDGTGTTDLTLLDGNGDEVDATAPNVSSTGTRTSTAVTAAAGTYRLLLDPRLDGTTTLTVRIEAE